MSTESDRHATMDEHLQAVGTWLQSTLNADKATREAAEEARIEAAGGTVEFGSLEGMLELSRGLGDFDFCDAGFSQEPHVAGPLRLGAEGDAVVVLASDGVWDVANERQISHFLRKSKNPQKVAKKICDFGKHQRLYGGLSPDDCSAVIVYLDTIVNIHC